MLLPFWRTQESAAGDAGRLAMISFNDASDIGETRSDTPRANGTQPEPSDNRAKAQNPLTGPSRVW